MPRHLGFSDSVNLTISLCLTYVLFVSGIRIWIRKGAFGVDDIVIAIATLISFGHTAADYVALANGLGKPWSHIISNENISSLNAVCLLPPACSLWKSSIDFPAGIHGRHRHVDHRIVPIEMCHDIISESNHQDALSARAVPNLQCVDDRLWSDIAPCCDRRLSVWKRLLLGVPH